MSAGTYLAGTAAVLAVGVALGWGAWRLRGALMPEWTGPPARLAEIVIAVAVPVGLGQLLGSFGAFERFPMLFGCLGVGVAMGVVGRRLAPSTGSTPVVAPEPPVRREPREEVGAAVLAVALVASQWFTYVASAWGTGMTDGDTLWYHGPFAGRFVQTGKLSGLGDLATEIHSFLPLNSSLYHALAILPFGNDFLSPLINLGWAALALLAAWCIGRRRGVGALCVLGAVVVLGLPTLVATQPGSASNDLATGALFLAALALLLEGGLAPVPTGLAAVAAGIGLGTKLTVAAPVAVLTVGVVFLAVRAKRWWTAGAWCGGLALSGGYWFVRNWVVNGNPTPYFELHLGPLSLDAKIDRHPTILDFVTDRSVWRRFFLPGLAEALGWLWPVLLVLALGGAALGVWRGRRPIERFAGAGVFAGVLAYAAIPGTGDLEGGLFVYTLRYVAPVLLIGFALLALKLAEAETHWRRAAWITMAAVAVVNVAIGRYDDFPAWARGEALAAVLAAAAVVAGAWVLSRAELRRRSTALVVGAGLVVVCGSAGWLVQDRYLERRYGDDAGLALDSANAVFRDVHDEKVAVFGTEQLYPMFGLDVSNRASKVRGPELGSEAELCAGWRDVLADGGYRYIVMGRQPWTEPGPAEEWLVSDSAVTQVLRDRDAVVFRVDGALDPDGCA
ncbi:MAG: hypothetical protein ACT4PI_05665 [Actinomycetota bacterium]